jgi:hypothetical protein
VETIDALQVSLKRRQTTVQFDPSASMKALCEQGGRVSSFTTVALQ